MKSKYLKILISLVLIVSLCLAMISVQSSAISAPIVIGGSAIAIGGLAWAIASAMGVDFSMRNYTSQTIGDAFNPWYTIQTALSTSDFTLIKGIRTGYDALRLSVSAYNAIKAGSAGIIENYEILDYDTGTIDIQGTLCGIPATTVNNRLETNTISVSGIGTYYIGDFRIMISDYGNNQDFLQIFYPANGSRITSSIRPTGFSWNFKVIEDTNRSQIVFDYGSTSGFIGNSVVKGNESLPYTSGEVDTSYGSGIENYADVIFPQINQPAAAPLDDILAAINELVLDGETFEVDIDETPPVPPQPIPTDALGDIPFDQFIDIYGGSVFDTIDQQTQVIDTLGQSVGQYIQDQTDTIDTYGQSVVEGIENQTDVIDIAGQSVVTAVENQTDVIDTVGQDVVDAIESVDTNIQTGTGILSGIRSLVDSAVDTLEDIGEMVGELVEDIVLGTETLISGILNQVPSLFNVILSPIKTAASIWHYVVEWIQSITGPFQFIWSMANGTSYYIVLPVYASLAAAVVLAFYKRFGK